MDMTPLEDIKELLDDLEAQKSVSQDRIKTVLANTMDEIIQINMVLQTYRSKLRLISDRIDEVRSLSFADVAPGSIFDSDTAPITIIGTDGTYRLGEQD